MKPVTGGFPASHRLKVKAQFDWVFDRPNQRCSHGVLQAIYKPAQHRALTHLHENTGIRLDTAPDSLELVSKNNNLEPTEARLGLIVAKRFLPRAVDRNRLKRLIREGFRAQHAQLPPVDIIVRLLRRPGQQVSAGEVTQLFGKMQRPSHPPNADSR